MALTIWGIRITELEGISWVFLVIGQEHDLCFCGATPLMKFSVLYYSVWGLEGDSSSLSLPLSLLFLRWLSQHLQKN